MWRAPFLLEVAVKCIPRNFLGCLGRNFVFGLKGIIWSPHPQLNCDDHSHLPIGVSRSFEDFSKESSKDFLFRRSGALARKFSLPPVGVVLLSSMRFEVRRRRHTLCLAWDVQPKRFRPHQMYPGRFINEVFGKAAPIIVPARLRRWRFRSENHLWLI